MPLSYVSSFPGPVRPGPRMMDAATFTMANPTPITSKSTTGAHDPVVSPSASIPTHCVIDPIIVGILYGRRREMQHGRNASFNCRGSDWKLVFGGISFKVLE